MSRTKYLLMKNVVLAAALAAGVSGVAHADDSSMSRFGGDSYAYFNTVPSNASADASWRLSHPNGFTERELEALSSRSVAYEANKPVFSSVAAEPSWRQSHPNGLSERELMALSSEAPAWQLPNNLIGRYAVASTDQANVAPSAAKPSLRDRIANFFHAARGG